MEKLAKFRVAETNHHCSGAGYRARNYIWCDL